MDNVMTILGRRAVTRFDPEICLFRGEQASPPAHIWRTKGSSPEAMRYPSLMAQAHFWL